MNRRAEPTSDPGPRPALSLRALVAAVVAVTVLLVTIRSQEPIGAGIYYDDGAYLALARSMATGEGYTYSNLPGSVPGVKYPPAYPAVLALAWRAFGMYPENLGALKALNAVFWGLAAGGAFLLFARGGHRRVIAFGLVAIYAFLTVPSMSVATVLLSEPLFLLVCVGALLLFSAEPDGPAASLADSERPFSWPAGHPSWAVAVGLVGAAAFLTRSVGLTLAAALLLPLLLRRRWRSAGLVGAAFGVPAVAWLAWARAHAADVPGPIAGQYGSYGTWLGQGLEGGALGRIGEVVGANWGPFVETLQFVWVPRAHGLALAAVLLVAGAAVVYGASSAWRRNPALVLFPICYLGLVFVWPYEPYRFYYAIVPLLTLLALEGLWEAAPTIRGDLPRWGIPVAAVVAVLFVVNALVYHGRGHVARSWASPQTIPARAYAPLNEWIRANTAPDAVIASALDPYVHWETGRPAVPSWRFLADDYGRYDRAPEVLAAGLDSAIVRFGARHVALVLGENKAARTLEAFVDLHPERALKIVQTEGPAVGVIYALAPPGEVLRDPEAGTSVPENRTELDAADSVPPAGAATEDSALP
ncbi:MAG: hypothetical protein Q8W45_10220 [Candidatus Palauibacterales bacterium]|nr:hypothetical protein [Candidatus Palauibacterales bacterium]MDP2483649.1 hypothetical protein [Candidatus Palauibacterales bacterium]